VTYIRSEVVGRVTLLEISRCSTSGMYCTIKQCTQLSLGHEIVGKVARVGSKVT